LVHPETIEGCRLDTDVGQMLHPVRPGPAGYDEARRGAVKVWQRLAVHLERDERALIQRPIDRKTLHEIRCSGQYRRIRTVEHHFERTSRNARLVQYITQPHPGPQRIAHGAVAPLDARYPRREQPASVSGALIDGRQAHVRETGLELS